MTDSSSKMQDGRPGSVMDETGNHEENCDLVQLEKLSLDDTMSPQKAQCPEDSQGEPPQELHIMQEIQQCTSELENSKSYLGFLEQLKSQPVLSKIQNALGTENQFQMVIYGIGSIESNSNSRTQLALVLLLKRNFDWIGEMEVFDPVLKDAERLVLEKLGCKVLLVNEGGRRKALKPTLFFMPHCHFALYDNLLKANWSPKLLNRLVILGNSFKFIKFHSQLEPEKFARSSQYVLHSQKLLYVEEFAVRSLRKEFFYPFNDTSWHFFHVDPSVKLKRL